MDTNDDVKMGQGRREGVGAQHGDKDTYISSENKALLGEFRPTKTYDMRQTDERHCCNPTCNAEPRGNKAP